jgi:hypothetical protein
MENEEILKIVGYLYRNALNWKKQKTFIYSHKDTGRDGAKYKNINTVYQMRDKGLLKIDDDTKTIAKVKGSNFTNLSDFLPYFEVSYCKRDLFEYLINSKTLIWGDFSISPRGLLKLGDKIISDSYFIDKQPRQFIAYMLLEEKASYEDLGLFFDVFVDKEKYLKLSDRKLVIKNGVKKIKRRAVKELVEDFKIQKVYVDKMIQKVPKYGYSLGYFVKQNK